LLTIPGCLGELSCSKSPPPLAIDCYVRARCLECSAAWPLLPSPCSGAATLPAALARYNLGDLIIGVYPWFGVCLWLLYWSVLANIRRLNPAEYPLRSLAITWETWLLGCILGLVYAFDFSTGLFLPIFVD
jgi:hypothetical protein